MIRPRKRRYRPQALCNEDLDFGGKEKETEGSCLAITAVWCSVAIRNQDDSPEGSASRIEETRRVGGKSFQLVQEAYTEALVQEVYAEVRAEEAYAEAGVDDDDFEDPSEPMETLASKPLETVFLRYGLQISRRLVHEPGGTPYKPFNPDEFTSVLGKSKKKEVMFYGFKHWNPTSRGEKFGAHTVGLFRCSSGTDSATCGMEDTFILFDPNYGEYRLPLHAMEATLRKSYSCLILGHILATVASTG